MVRGPLAQLIPTTAAPASSRRRQASGIGTPSIVSSGQYGAKVMTAGTPIECIVQRQQSLTTVDKSKKKCTMKSVIELENFRVTLLYNGHPEA